MVPLLIKRMRNGKNDGDDSGDGGDDGGVGGNDDEGVSVNVVAAAFDLLTITMTVGAKGFSHAQVATIKRVADGGGDAYKLYATLPPAPLSKRAQPPTAAAATARDELVQKSACAIDGDGDSNSVGDHDTSGGDGNTMATAAMTTTAAMTKVTMTTATTTTVIETV
jgi:hypothetical protein